MANTSASFFHGIGTENTYEDVRFEDFDDRNANQDFYKGICFSDVKVFQQAAKSYSMKAHRTYKVVHSLAKQKNTITQNIKMATCGGSRQFEKHYRTRGRYHSKMDRTRA